MPLKPNSFLLCMGTRPEIIKMAPVYRAMVDRAVPVALLHTGQHIELAMQMYDFFGMQPDYTLHLNRLGNSLEHLSALLIEKIGQVITVVQPRAVLVHGDTSSALMAAMAAFYHKVPVAHVEAGLRSHNDYDPFPEEKNREMIARLARWHFAPTSQAEKNLQREGIAKAQIHIVGNTVVDAVAMGQSKIRNNQSVSQAIETHPKLRKTLGEGKRIVLVTAHRRENWDGPLLSIARAIRSIVVENPDVVVVWPVHANPAVGKTVYSVLGKLPKALQGRVLLVDPLSYPELLHLLTRAWLVLTDSGGIQEEAASLHVPILVLRDTTERPELLDEGGGKLIGTKEESIVRAVRDLVEHPQEHLVMRQARNPFGDGTAAQQIVDTLFARNT